MKSCVILIYLLHQNGMNGMNYTELFILIDVIFDNIELSCIWLIVFEFDAYFALRSNWMMHVMR